MLQKCEQHNRHTTISHKAHATAHGPSTVDIRAADGSCWRRRSQDRHRLLHSQRCRQAADLWISRCRTECHVRSSSSSSPVSEGTYKAAGVGANSSLCVPLPRPSSVPYASAMLAVLLVTLAAIAPALAAPVTIPLSSRALPTPVSGATARTYLSERASLCPFPMRTTLIDVCDRQ